MLDVATLFVVCSIVGLSTGSFVFLHMEQFMEIFIEDATAAALMSPSSRLRLDIDSIYKEDRERKEEKEEKEENEEKDQPLVFQDIQSPSFTRVSIGSGNDCSKRIKTPVSYK